MSFHAVTMWLCGMLSPDPYAPDAPAASFSILMQAGTATLSSPSYALNDPLP
jgi:hypothetical protein